MNYDLVVCGVGGQGVLTIAAVIDRAIHEAGLYLKQSEVHGMAQRGGAVSAFVRISDQPVASDLIAEGTASMVLSVEPMEALRYTNLLRPDGCIVSDITPMENVAVYPKHDALYQVLFSAPRLVAINGTRLAKKAGSIKVQNVVVLGAAASFLPLPPELLEAQLALLFAPKGERIVKANINAFRIGDALVQQSPGCLGQTGADSGLVPGWEVALDDHHVFEDFVRLGKKFDDAGDLVAVIEPFCPIGICQCGCTEGCHGISLLLVAVHR